MCGLDVSDSPMIYKLKSATTRTEVVSCSRPIGYVKGNDWKLIKVDDYDDDDDDDDYDYDDDNDDDYDYDDDNDDDYDDSSDDCGKARSETPD